MYKVITARVTANDVIPPEEEKEEVISSPVLSSEFTCSKCHVPTFASVQSNPNLQYCVCGGYLTRKSQPLARIVDKVCVLLTPPKHGTQTVVASMDNIAVGKTVCRKIRMNTLGIVTNITYAWGTVKFIQQVWVKWTGKPEATPYALTELLVVTIH